MFIAMILLLFLKPHRGEIEKVRCLRLIMLCRSAGALFCFLGLSYKHDAPSGAGGDLLLNSIAVRAGKWGLFLADLKAPPLPAPLLHFAEEREKAPPD